MISLQPREQFAIVRQLGDHTDLTTYYVQAVIRNSVTSDIIATVNLTDKTGGRFMKMWEVPSDVSGLGFYIDITITVYDDAGYTSKASAYGVDNEQYLIFDRIVKSGGGGSADVDYKKIGKLIADAIKKIEPPEGVDLSPVLSAVADVMKEVQAIDIPEAEKMDHTPVLSAIAESRTMVMEAIDKKEVTEKTDLAEVLAKIDEKEPNLDNVYQSLATFKQAFDTFVEEYQNNEGAKDKLDEMRTAFEPILQGIPLRKTPVKPVKTPEEIASSLLP